MTTATRATAFILFPSSLILDQPLGLRPSPSFLPLFRPGGTENIAQAVIAFMAVEWQQRCLRPLQRHPDRPRPRPGRRILERCGPRNRLRSGRSEMLDDPERGRIRTTIRRFGGEVRRFDHQRIALPVAASVAHVLTDGTTSDTTNGPRNHASH